MSLLCILVAIPLVAADPVALRTSGGRFLRAADDGALRAESWLPGPAEMFQWTPRGDDRVALRAANRRFLVPALDGKSLSALGATDEPGQRETFQWLLVGSNRTALRLPGARQFFVFDAKPAATVAVSPNSPGAGETIEVVRVVALPDLVQTAFGTALRVMTMKELGEKQYDKTNTRKIRKTVDLPAPTLRDPKRTKEHRLLSMTEEYRVEARLDGQAEIRLAAMPFLGDYHRREQGLLMYHVAATLPVQGRVRYRIPDLVSASTGYRATVKLDAIGEVRMKRSGDKLTLADPQVRQLRVAVERLDLSNDVLQAFHKAIQDVLNHELRGNDERIRRQADKSLTRALDDKEFRHPLVRLMPWP